MSKFLDLQERLYQDNDLAAINNAFEENRSVLYQLPTGGGKSVIITRFVDSNRKKNILVLSHKRRLLTQMRSHLKRAGLSKVGLMIGQREEEMESNVVIVSIRTAVKESRLQYLVNRKWDYVIIDEARHSRTGSYDTVLDTTFEAQPMCRLLGVDATPYRKDKKRLDKHFQYMVVSEENVASLIDKGYLQSCKAIVSPIDKESLKEQVKEYTGDYQMTQLSGFMRQEKYIEYVINQYKQYGESRQAIVFAVDKAHARDLKVAFENAGYKGKVEQIDSDLDTATIEAAYAAFESKKCQILINVEMATEGVDLPSCGCIIGARPTKSLTLYLQMAGRGTRPDGEHDYFILLDCCGWTDEFGTITSPKQWSLDPDVDPNNPRTKNKVVGRKQDGTYTEDLTNFIGEVVEMTPEEYITHLSGGMEMAKKVNVSIEEKIDKLQNGITVLYADVLKKDWKDLYCEIKSNPSGFECTFTLTAELPEDKRVYWIDKVTVEMYENIDQWYAKLGDHRKTKSYMRLSQVAATINQNLLDKDELRRKVIGLMKQVKELKKQKIDIDQYKQASEKIKKEQWQKKVQEHAATHGIFVFNGELKRDFDWYFKTDNWSVSNSRIAGIEMSKINAHHNTIILLLERSNTRWKDGEKVVSIEKGREEKKYVKGEKVWQILEDFKWGMEEVNN